MKEGEQAQAEISGGRKLSVRAVREFYFEEGELRMPATFDTTPEEKKARLFGINRDHLCSLRWMSGQNSLSNHGRRIDPD